jgi:hypothetical protein
MFRRFLLTAVTAVIASLASNAKSEAAFSVKIDVYSTNPYSSTGAINPFVSGGTLLGSQEIFDGSAGDGNSNPNRISLIATIAGVNIDISSLTNGPSGNPAWVSQTTANLTNVTRTLNRWVVITITDTFSPIGTGDGAPFSLSTTANTTGQPPSGGLTKGAGVRVVSGVEGTDPNQVYTDTLTLPNSATAPLTTDPVAFDRLAGDFKLKNFIVVSLPGASGAAPGSSASFSSSAMAVSVAPAPAGLIMAATALPFFGLLRRRLRKSEVANAA